MKRPKKLYIMTKHYGSTRFVMDHPSEDQPEPPQCLEREFATWRAKRDAHKRRSPEPIVRVWKLVKEYRP